MPKKTEKRKFEWENLNPWWLKAKEFGEKNKTWHAVEYGSEEHKAWQRYFDELEWEPVFWRQFKARPDSIATLPAQWPEYLGQ